MMDSYGSEGEFVKKGNKMAGSKFRLNGHGVPILLTLLQITAVLTGGGMFIRSVEQSIDKKMDAIDKKIDMHIVASKKNIASFSFHHTIGNQCSRGCHIVLDSPESSNGNGR